MSPGRSVAFEVVSLIVALCLPFGFLYWLVPFASDLTIGKDYPIFSTPQQQELLYSLRAGSFPLYVPGFAGGQSASALTLGQIFHPLTYLAATGPGYWDGAALEWNTFFRLLSIGLTQWLWFRLLMALRVRPVFAFVASAALLHNLRMLDLFRYGASLEGYTGHLMAAACVFWVWLRPERLLPKIGLVAATYCLVCSGHPQMMYYGLLGVGLAALVAPPYSNAMLAGAGENAGGGRVASFYARVAGLGGIGALLASAYVLPFYFDFLSNNAERVGNDYAWADGYRDSLAGTLNNFFQPLHASVMGAFGGSVLWLVAALVPLAVLRTRVPAIIWGVWAIAVLLFLHMQGERTPVHEWAWKTLPLAQSFRVAGRISLILPFLLVLLFAWLGRAGDPTKRFGPLALVSGAAIALAVGYAGFTGTWSEEVTKFSAVRVNEIPSWIHRLVFGAGLATASGLIAIGLGRKHGLALAGGVLLVAGTSLQLVACLRHGTWVVPKSDTVTKSEMDEQRSERLDSRPDAGHGMYSSAVARQLEHGALEPYLARLCPDFECVDDTESAYAVLRERPSVRRVVLEGQPDPTWGSARSQVPAPLVGSVRATYSSFNRLVFESRAEVPSFLVFGPPYSPHWSADVDGERAEIYRANGGAHAVRVPAGTSRVDFRFSTPASVAGMAISCATLALAGAVCLWRRLRGARRTTAVAVALVSVCAAFGVWYRGLHTGDDLGLTYAWSAAALGEEHARNMAYGRATSVSTMPFDEHLLHWYGSGRAVDGERGRPGARTRVERAPTWSVDLGSVRPIGRVELFEGANEIGGPGGPPTNARPLIIEGSRDGKRWIRLASVETRTESRPTVVLVEGRDSTRQTARFIRIRARSGSSLALDEVEVFAP